MTEQQVQRWYEIETRLRAIVWHSAGTVTSLLTVAMPVIQCEDGRMIQPQWQVELPMRMDDDDAKALVAAVIQGRELPVPPCEPVNW